jgi:hypothetical protein
MVVLRVLPAGHQRAAAGINAAIGEIVHMLNGNGLCVRSVCADGVSTYVHKLGPAFSPLVRMAGYDLHDPIHGQAEVLARVAMSGTLTLCCFDIDDQ